MKNFTLLLFLFWFSAAVGQETKNCRPTEEQLRAQCHDIEKLKLPIELRFGIAVKNSVQLTAVKEWAEKNKYKTEASEPVEGEPMIVLITNAGTFSCKIYHDIYSQVETGLDKLGFGCFRYQSAHASQNK